MKGPGIRLDLDVRRLWRCPDCNTERKTAGDVLAVACHFCKAGPLMTLVERQQQDRPLRLPVDMVIELHPDDVDAPAFVPLHLRVEEPTGKESASKNAADPPSDPQTKPTAKGKGAKGKESSDSSSDQSRADQSNNVSAEEVTVAAESKSPVETDAESGTTPEEMKSEEKKTPRTRRPRRKKTRQKGSGQRSGKPPESQGQTPP